MSKTIDTLVPDIYQVLRNSLDGKGVQLTIEQQAELGAAIAGKVRRALDRKGAARLPKTLRMSEIGKPCLRQLWYSVYYPELGEKLMPHTQFKFLYGDILEELVLFLAKVADHKVEGEQEQLEFMHNGWRILGHRDAIIDDVLVDVKSASSYSFKKFEEGLDDSNDAFGYRTQLECYDYGEAAKGRARGRRMGWVPVDKQNGTIGFSEHSVTAAYGTKLRKRLDAITAALDNPVVEPARTFELVPEGKSGNMKLGVECSYCSFKKECWKMSNAGYGLRAFSYAGRPVFLGTVVRTPKVPEIPLTEADSETITITETADATSTGDIV